MKKCIFWIPEMTQLLDNYRISLFLLKDKNVQENYQILILSNMVVTIMCQTRTSRLTIIKNKCDSIFHILSITKYGHFINYVRVPREGEGLEKSLHTLTLGRGESNPSLRNIFQVDILYQKSRGQVVSQGYFICVWNVENEFG